MNTFFNIPSAQHDHGYPGYVGKGASRGYQAGNSANASSAPAPVPPSPSAPPPPDRRLVSLQRAQQAVLANLTQVMRILGLPKEQIARITGAYSKFLATSSAKTLASGSGAPTKEAGSDKKDAAADQAAQGDGAASNTEYFSETGSASEQTLEINAGPGGGLSPFFTMVRHTDQSEQVEAGTDGATAAEARSVSTDFASKMQPMDGPPNGMQYSEQMHSVITSQYAAADQTGASTTSSAAQGSTVEDMSMTAKNVRMTMGGVFHGHNFEVVVANDIHVDYSGTDNSLKASTGTSGSSATATEAQASGQMTVKGGLFIRMEGASEQDVEDLCSHFIVSNNASGNAIVSTTGSGSINGQVSLRQVKQDTAKGCGVGMGFDCPGVSLGFTVPVLPPVSVVC